MRRFAILPILALLFASSAVADTWTIYVHPSGKTSTETSRQTSPKPHPKFFTDDEIKLAIGMASDAVGRFADWELRAVESSNATIRLYSHNPSSYSKMYRGVIGGQKVHAAGLFRYTSPPQIFIHDGWIPKATSNSGYAGWWKFTGGSLRSLAGLILHEVGHHTKLVGNSHRLDLGRLMLANPPAGEIELVRKEFGAPKPKDPPEPGNQYEELLAEIEAIKKRLAMIEAPRPPPNAQIVRIDLPGKTEHLTLAEVQVFSNGTNVALGGTATQSSEAFEGSPEIAIEGDTDGTYRGLGSLQCTEKESEPWWQVDLGRALPIDSVVVWNRTDKGTRERLDGFRLTLMDGNHGIVYQRQFAKAPQRELSIPIAGDRRDGGEMMAEQGDGFEQLKTFDFDGAPDL